MIAKRANSGWRTAAVAVALFAITVNFLQPLAHAALMRDGAPTALWTAFCNSIAADPDGGQSQMPSSAGKSHECCLGLAHAPAMAEPPQTYVVLEPTVRIVHFDVSFIVRAAIFRHERPSQPRAPPPNS
jgi:hypothetical protein